MAKFDKIIQSTGENLYEDESLRSNLTDSEAKIILDWAMRWITDQVNMARDAPSAKQVAQSELMRVRSVVSAINAYANKPGVPKLGDAVTALDATLNHGKATTREEVFGLLTTLASAMWKLRTPR